MPMATKEEQREYQRLWMARRRAEFFTGKACVDCGAVEDLQIDHLDPALKVSHVVWSWAQERREAELAKCVVRCRECHKIRHGKGSHGHGGYKRGCRCSVCRAAEHENYLRKRDRRRRANKPDQVDTVSHGGL
jgi:hypothetical protein